eukprot:gnl/TRDRNA2_/TRDRNA2_157723_c0_seq1.p1 gnl/TRDRNA2_/TRDRNA2_157723_c0~~gnl/TRDRNA2_/TRDRNA2_157723_c0_seq1.p1  ORF type:complete len:555 (+),score=63.62 gnl/TRDRNA2_/TRDRNA2_157723_c0_seq1:22-1665(+)
MSGAGSGFAGTVDGSFFRLPKWVDAAKAPGTTCQTPTAWATWAKNIVTMKLLFFGPNFIWLSIAAAVYVLFPYDYTAARTLSGRRDGSSVPWVLERVILNIFLLYGYYGFWEVTLYCWGWSKRKFRGSWDANGRWVPTSWPTGGRLLHNMWYCFLGTLQYSFWEVVCVHLFATGKMPHISDAEASAALLAPFSGSFTSEQAGICFRLLFWTAVIPVWAGAHFYFAHRFIHMRFLYKYVHCLHHRNTDIEPFSGLAMHPVEHLYYFTCLGLSLYFYMSPFHLLWNGIHRFLSPAASHSGWEDHTQSDQFHYLHHVNFECNYGSASVPLDNFFGTFREKLGESKTYRGAAGEGGKVDVHKLEDKSTPAPKAAAAATTPARKRTASPAVRTTADKNGSTGAAAASSMSVTYTGLKTGSPNGFGVYMIGSAVLFAMLLARVAVSPDLGGFVAVPGGCFEMLQQIGARSFAALVAFGPLVLGALLMLATADSMSMRWPFHKEPIIGSFGTHSIVGFAVSVLPAYHLLTALLLPQREGVAYCSLWSCPPVAGL